MNNETKIKEGKNKHKSPSKQKRDATRMERIRSTWHPPHTVETATQTEENDSEGAPNPGIDPRYIYQDMHRSLQLARLEDPPVLTTALRHLVRVGHKEGGRITFPVMEAVDRIHLKSLNLPTSFGELLRLIHEVFHRRGEVFDIEEIYKQAVRAYGKMAFEPTKSYPDCYIHTFMP